MCYVYKKSVMEQSLASKNYQQQQCLMMLDDDNDA